MTNDDWRALLESFLADENDCEGFCEEFLEALANARDAKSRIPRVIDDLIAEVEGFDPEDDDAESNLKEEARKALEALQT